MKTDVAPIVSRPAVPVAPAAAEVRFERVAGRTAITRLRSVNPLKLLATGKSIESAWVFAATYGGGMLAGDRIALNVNCRPVTRAMLGTQSSTKVYRNPAGRPTEMRLNADVERDALLAVLPDPVVCFAGSHYEQRQRFDLADGASLVLLDGFTCGRLARGERWEMDRYQTTTDIFIANRRVLHDAVRLDAASETIARTFSVGRFNCFSNVILLGPLCKSPAKELIESVHARKLERQGELLLTASPLAGGAIFRIAATSVERMHAAVKELLAFVPGLLGDNPWSRKW